MIYALNKKHIGYNSIYHRQLIAFENYSSLPAEIFIKYQDLLFNIINENHITFIYNFEKIDNNKHLLQIIRQSNSTNNINPKILLKHFVHNILNIKIQEHEFSIEKIFSGLDEGMDDLEINAVINTNIEKSLNLHK